MPQHSQCPIRGKATAVSVLHHFHLSVAGKPQQCSVKDPHVIVQLTKPQRAAKLKLFLDF